MLPKKQQETYDSFRDTVRNNEIFDPKTTLLLHLCTAMALGCAPCIEAYLAKAMKQGFTEEEIGAVQGVVMGLSSGRVDAQLREAQRRVKERG